MQSEQPAPLERQQSEIRQMFDGLAADYDRSRESQFSFLEQKRLVLEMLEGVRGRVLDLGCGPALMEPDLLKRGFEVWGIDASPEMIRLGRARLGPAERERCRLQVGHAERLPFDDACFDALISMGVLEYVLSPPRALAEMRRVLKPGGTLVLTVPSSASDYSLGERIYRNLKALMKRILGHPAVRGPTVIRRAPSEVDQALAQAGFRKLAARHCNFIFFPLHELSAQVSTALNRALTPRLSRSPLGRLLGHQYVVKAAAVSSSNENNKDRPT